MEGRLISRTDETSSSSGEDLSFDGGSGDGLRSLFDQVLQVFLSDMSGKKYIADNPALLGDGKPIDLFKLFWVVWRGGGFDSVSQNGLWDLVAEECGLKNEVVSSIKLVYMTYLNDLDQWLETTIRNRFSGSQEIEVGGKLGLLLLELKKVVRGSLHGKLGGKSKDGSFELKRTNNWQNKGSKNTAKRELLSPDASGSCTSEVHVNAEKNTVDGDKKDLGEVNMEITVSDTTVSNSCKRKRACLSDLPGMLNWVMKVARNPRDPAIGRLPEISKWKERGTDEFWVQALLVREANLVKLPDSSNMEESSQQETNLPKKQRMHPSMYKDNNVHNPQSRERVRCSARVSSSAKSRFCPCCTSCSASTHKVATCQKEAATETNPKEEDILEIEKIPTKKNNDITDEKSRQKQVRVGPLFQAEVPQWTGVVTESDSKWFGPRMWPPEDGKQALVARKYRCSCHFPGSVVCVRFHIAEERLKLKLEIGKSFYAWKFHLMGEEVALSWTNKEEKRFKDMIKMKSPWPYKSFKFFPRKTRAELVRYYFNVYLVRRRAYQNRVTPKEIDSDDDEKEVGSIGNSYGDDAGIVAPGSKALVCVESKQCTDW